MKSGEINSENFKHVGVLVLDRKLEGSVRHVLENTVDGSIKRIQFDERLNEVVDIGSDIEQMNVKQSIHYDVMHIATLLSIGRLPRQALGVGLLKLGVVMNVLDGRDIFRKQFTWRDPLQSEDPNVTFFT
ncbi:unnamed protein product [Angiostrongylus costaricensis]|uniref:ANF_receptor domain-containing protein n=1 Tax=Angiostrongylus costaricensis TaxID=334426 RepID=A0A158PKH7_ANGCS|nr:unnamed protein product [Angiostrongylus costaricensis]